MQRASAVTEEPLMTPSKKSFTSYPSSPSSAPEWPATGEEGEAGKDISAASPSHTEHLHSWSGWGWRQGRLGIECGVHVWLQLNWTLKTFPLWKNFQHIKLGGMYSKCMNALVPTTNYKSCRPMANPVSSLCPINCPSPLTYFEASPMSHVISALGFWMPRSEYSLQN